jgi:C-terminal processing protease CtpA/Prc
MTEKPTPIDLVIVRENTDKPQEIKLQTQYPTNELRIQKIEKNITHVELTRIDDDQVKILKSRLAQDYLENKPLKLIIDLRKYEGGDIEPFIELTTIFFNRTIPLTLKLKNETESYTLGTDKTPDYQAVVIIDKSTMMYGELLATLFKTYGAKNKITLVGNKTRGFTSKMIQIPLDDGSSILLTAGLFLIEGKNPPKTGVIPDIEIKGDEAPTIIDRSIATLNKTHD